MFRGILENASTYRDHVKPFVSSFLKFNVQELQLMKNRWKNTEITS